MFLHFPFHFTMQRIILFSISHFQQLCWHFQVKTAFDLLMPDLKALWEWSLENGYKWDFGGQKNKTLLFLSFCRCYLCTHVRAIEPHFWLIFLTLRAFCQCYKWALFGLFLETVSINYEQIEWTNFLSMPFMPATFVLFLWKLWKSFRKYHGLMNLVQMWRFFVSAC